MQTTVTYLKEDAKIIHYPNLKTVLMVEEVLKEADGPLTREEIKRKMPTGVMHQTLNVILNYLENRGMIYDGKKGIIWIYTPRKELDALIEKGIEV